MPNFRFGLQTVGDYQISVSLPANAFIEEFFASYHGTCWTVAIITTKQQISTITDRQGNPMQFASLDAVARFLAEHGATDLSVSLLGLISGERAA